MTRKTPTIIHLDDQVKQLLYVLAANDGRSLSGYVGKLIRDAAEKEGVS